MKKMIVIDDVTGEEIKDYITVSIEKEGYMIEYPKGCFTNRLELHIEEKNLPEVMKRAKFRKMETNISRLTEIK